MPYYPLEAFCHVEYPQELTYEELIACEAELIAVLEEQLAAMNAVHVDVFPDGDALKVHCAFMELSFDDFTDLAHRLADSLLRCGKARLMLLRKDLSGARLATYHEGVVNVRDVGLQ